MRRRVGVLGVALVVVAGAAGCSPAVPRAAAPTAAATTPAADAASKAPQPRLETPQPHGYVIRDLVVGQRFTDGWETLHIKGSDPIVIRKVETLGGAPGLRQVGALVAGGSRSVGSIQSDRSFPPPKDPGFGPLIPAVGAELTARPRGELPYWELVIGYRVTRPGAWKRKSIAITYESNGETFTQRFPAVIIACTKGESAACTAP